MFDPSPDCQIPGVYRRSVGAMTITAIADGYAMLPLGTVPEVSADDAEALARTSFVPPGDLQCVVNTFVVRTPSRLVMIDTGFGAGGPGTPARSGTTSPPPPSTRPRSIRWS